MKILIIEDDKILLQHIKQGLTQAGYSVDVSADGKEGLFMAASESYDLLIVDRMLPHIDGLTIIRTLRASHTETAVLILSALDEVDQRVEGLSAGGDDYLTKPFAFKELLARVQALLRRAQQPLESVPELRAQNVRLDLIKQKVWVGDTAVSMQPREFRLLEYLMRHQGEVVSRTMLLENVWEYHFDPQTNIIDVHISRLRQKLDTNREKSLITTMRGVGYVLETH
jgi:two-component system OmpR family response regulator